MSVLVHSYPKVKFRKFKTVSGKVSFRHLNFSVWHCVGSSLTFYQSSWIHQHQEAEPLPPQLEALTFSITIHTKVSHSESQTHLAALYEGGLVTEEQRISPLQPEKYNFSTPPPNKPLLIINVAFRALHRRGNVSNTEGDDSRGGGGEEEEGDGEKVKGWDRTEEVRCVFGSRKVSVAVWHLLGVSSPVTASTTLHPPPSSLLSLLLTLFALPPSPPHLPFAYPPSSPRALEWCQGSLKTSEVLFFPLPFSVLPQHPSSFPPPPSPLLLLLLKSRLWASSLRLCSSPKNINSLFSKHLVAQILSRHTLKSRETFSSKSTVKWQTDS